MASVAPQAADNSPGVTAAHGAALAYTPEEAAAIIGGRCKASYLRQLARDREIPFLWVGKYAFTAEHIRAIVAYCDRPAKTAKPAAAAAPKPSRAKPAAAAPLVAVPAPGVTQLKARQPRRRGAA